MAADLEIVRVRSDLRAAGEINEFQFALLLLPLLFGRRICAGLFADSRVQAIEETHQHRDDLEQLLLSRNYRGSIGQTLRNQDIQTRCAFERRTASKIEKTGNGL